MGRLLTIFIIIFVIYWLLRTYFRSLQRPAASNTTKRPAAENMVRCAQCGVNLPQTEAFFSRGEYFCNDEHRQHRQQ